MTFKKLEIIIKPEKLEDLKSIPDSCGAHGLMISNIMGYGSQKGYTQMYRGTKYTVNLLPKVKVETVVCEEIVEAIIRISYRPVIIEGDNGKCHYLLLLYYSVPNKEVTIMENILSEVFGIWFLIGASFVFFMQAGFAMAERTNFLSYCIYSGIISAVVYPIEAHWIWGGVTMFIVFKVIDKIFGLRVTDQEQLDGLDIHEHGMNAYYGFRIDK